MKPARWHQIEHLYTQALEMEESQRIAFLREACAGDDALRHDVEKLLAEGPGSFLEEPALQGMAREFAGAPAASWIGRRIGNYEFLSLVGAGGMGEVYRAHDTKLKREVAIKILPDEFARDPDRVSRFQREAQLLASLNHPNIGAIYGLEEDGRSRFLILELVEGATLAERLKRGAIPVNEALQIASQIAEGLGAAHDRGILHRDLKPVNIKLTPDGKVKVLDFGLAKAFSGDGAEVDSANSPTKITVTMPGMLMGTPAYMSPEQARGKDTDRTADVWAFGCVLYEMLTGHRVFEGETVGEILGGVFKTDPDWNRLPAETPEGIRRLLRRCLQKEQQLRLRDLHDVRLEIADIASASSTASQAAPSRTRRWARPALVSALTGTIVFAAVWGLKPAPMVPQRLFEINPPPTTDPVSMALSSNGGKIVSSVAVGGQSQLAVRSLDSLDTSIALLPGTEGAQFPFWSPDDRSIGFFANTRLKTIELDGAAIRDLTYVPFPRGGTWNRDDIILFSNGTAPIFSISARGGSEPVAVTHGEGNTSHKNPHFLPDGRHFLFWSTLGPSGSSGIYVGDLVTRDMHRLIDEGSNPVYASPGQLLFVLDATKLIAQSFDAERLQLIGNRATLAEQIILDGNLTAALSVSAAGPIAYRTGQAGEPKPRLAWYDPSSGNQLRTLDDVDSRKSLDPALSSDGLTLAISRYLKATQKRKSGTCLGTLDLERSSSFNQFTFRCSLDVSPIWSPDSSRIVYTSRGEGAATNNLYQKRTGGAGSEDLLLSSTMSIRRATDWSRVSPLVLYESANSKGGADIWALSMEGDAKRSMVVQSERNFETGGAQFSPDGNWIAYYSNETSRSEIYIQPYPGPGGKRGPISTNGGGQVRWGRDGKELFYIAADNRLMRIPVKLDPKGSAIEISAAAGLFMAPPLPTQTGLAQYVVLPNGQFLFNTVAVEPISSPINILQNWKPKP